MTKAETFRVTDFKCIFFSTAQGLIGTLFIRANIWWSRLRKQSRIGQYPIAEVLILTLINAVVAYPNPYTRMSSTRLIYLLFAQCGVDNNDMLWYFIIVFRKTNRS